MRLSNFVAGLVFAFGLTSCAQTPGLLGSVSLPGAETTASTAPQPDGKTPPLPQRRVAKARPEKFSLGTGALLAALPKIDLTAPAVAPSSVIAEDTPIAVYTVIARQIHRCWLGPNKPKLANHSFRADASNEGGGHAKIDIFQKVPGRKLGPFAFHVEITPEGTGTLVRSRNSRVPAKLANTLRGDIARWVKGEESCTATGKQ